MSSWIHRLTLPQARYVFPFHARLGTEFLVFLAALMTVLCLFSVTASLSLGRLADRWTSGLEDTITIEIPYSADRDRKAVKVLDTLKQTEGVLKADLVSKEEMQDLLSPWLGESSDSIDKLPLPALISVQLKERNDVLVRRIRQMMEAVEPEAHVDAHEKWLSDLLRLTGALNVASLLLLLGIGLVTTLTVAGAVRSRMAIHHTELELLHLMGADDQYIARQFQKYIAFLTGRGVIIGFVVSLAAAIGLAFMNRSDSAALQGLQLDLLQYLALPVTAAFLFLISILTARHTALKVLRDMP